MPKVHNIKLAIFYAIISAFSCAAMGSFIKFIPQTIPNSEILFFRFMVSLVFLMPWMALDKHFTFRVNRPWLYVGRILCGLLSIATLFYSLRYIPLVNVIVLQDTAPLFLPLIVLIFFRLQTPLIVLFGIILGFFGVILVLHPGHEMFQTAALYALASGFFAACSGIFVRILGQTSSVKQVLVYYFLACTIISGIFMLFNWHTPDLHEWLLLLGAGIAGTFYQLFWTLAFINGQARLVAPAMYFSIVFAGLFDWIFWLHTPHWMTICGTLLVVGGALITVYFGKKSEHLL